VFLMNNVHDDTPVVFQTRWTLSYLRGPLTRQQIQQLTAARKSAAEPAGPPVPAASPQASLPAAGLPAAERPVVPPGIKECFLAAKPADPQKRLVYRPGLLGTARLHYVHAKSGTDVWQTVARWTTECGDEVGDVWANAEPLDESEPKLLAAPAANAGYSSLPAELARAKAYTAWTKSLKEYLYRERPLTLKYCPQLQAFSRADESEADFRIRLQTAAREHRDLETEKLKKRYEPKLASLADQKRRAEERVAREKSQYRQQQTNTFISFGASLLGALIGRKLTSSTNVTRAASAMKGVGKSLEQRDDIGRAEDSVEGVEEKLAKLEGEFQEELARIEQMVAVDRLALEDVSVQPRKTDLAIGTVALLWTPWYVGSDQTAERGF
jgi:hypothetical protein